MSLTPEASRGLNTAEIIWADALNRLGNVVTLESNRRGFAKVVYLVLDSGIGLAGFVFSLVTLPFTFLSIRPNEIFQAARNQVHQDDIGPSGYHHGPGGK